MPPLQTVTFTRKIKRRGELVVVCPPRAAQPSRLANYGIGTAAELYSPPLSRTTPLTKKIGRLCSLRSQSPHGALKGGNTPLPAGNGVRSRKKRKLPVCVFFCRQAASMPPRRCSDSWAYYAHPEPINLQTKRTMPHG